MEARLEYCVCTVVILPYIQALVFERSYGGLPKLSDMTPTSREGFIPDSGVRTVLFPRMPTCSRVYHVMGSHNCDIPWSGHRNRSYD